MSFLSNGGSPLKTYAFVFVFIMSLINLLLLIFSVHSLASPILSRRAASFAFPGDAPYTVDPATLAAALTCPNGSPTQSSPPVLLVHGTTSTGQESWGNGYVPVSTHVTFSASSAPYNYSKLLAWPCCVFTICQSALTLHFYLQALHANGYTACYVTLRE